MESIFTNLFFDKVDFKSETDGNHLSVEDFFLTETDLSNSHAAVSLTLSPLLAAGQSTSGLSSDWNNATAWSNCLTGAPSNCVAGLPTATSGTTSAPVIINHNLTFQTGTKNLSITDGVYTFNKNVFSTGNLTINRSGNSSTKGILDITGGITTFQGLTYINNTTLHIRSGATLILGTANPDPSYVNTANVLTIDNASKLVVEAGATLIVYGSVLDNNNGSNGVFTVAGYVQIYGNYLSTLGNVQVDATGTTPVFSTTGSIKTSNNSSTVFNSPNECVNGPCSAGALSCGTSNTAYTASISPANQLLCSGQAIPPISFTTNASGTITYQWQVSTTSGGSGFTDITSATASTYSPSQPSQTTWYRMVYSTSSCTGTTLISPSSQISLDSSPAPVSGSISGGNVTYCSTTNNTSLILTGFTGTIQRQSSTNNTSFSNIVGQTSSTYTVTNLSATTYYRAILSSGLCNTATTSSVAVTVSTTAPTITSTVPGSRCGAGSVALTVTPSSGVVKWYAASTGGSALFTGSNFTSPNINATTTYYVDATDGCTTPTRTAVTATIDSTPQIISTTDGSTCGPGSVTLKAGADAGHVHWYESPTGGPELYIGVMYSTPVISTTTTYYVDATINNCTSATRTAVKAIVNAIPTITSTTNGSICGSGTGALTATPSAGTINWHSNAIGGTHIFVGTNFTSPSLTATTNYYVEAEANGCLSPTRTTITATVNPIPVVSIPSNNLCARSTMTLSPAVGGVWTSSNSSVATVTNDGVVTGVSTGNATFTFTNTATNCSATTSSITVIAATTWLGVSNNWSDPSNWSCGTVPSFPFDITIPGALTNYPVLNTESISVKNLSIVNGASFVVNNSTSQLEIYGDFINDGSFTNKQGTISFLGSNQTISGTSTTDFYNVKVAGTNGTVTLNSSANLYGTLSVSNGAQFDADGNGAATLLTIKSSSITENGSIGVIPAGSSVTGNINVERYMDALGGTFRYISSPVISNPSKPNGIDKIYEYNNGWAAASTMQSGKGYAALVYNNMPVKWTVNGSTNNGDHPWTFASEGWYLIGNPYASAIQWRNPNDSNPSTDGWDFANSNNISSTIAITDNHTGVYPDYFRYYDYSQSTQTTSKVVENGVIASGQAFWIYVGVGGGNLTVKQSAKSTLPNSFYKKADTKMDQMVIHISNGKISDHTVLRIDEKSTTSYEFNHDLPKLWNQDMNVYLVDKSNREMLINAVPQLDETLKMPLGINVTEPGVYSLSFSNADQFSYGATIHLVDQYKGVLIPVSSSESYSFTINDVNKNLTDRFYLTIVPAVELNLERAISFYPNPVKDILTIEVSDPSLNSSAMLMDINGNIMLSNDFKGDGSIDMKSYPAGMYIVKLKTAAGIVTKKIVKYD